MQVAFDCGLKDCNYTKNIPPCKSGFYACNRGGNQIGA